MTSPGTLVLGPRQYHDWHWIAGILYTSRCPVCEPWHEKHGGPPVEWDGRTLFAVERERND